MMPEDTALHEAVRYGDLETASALLQSGGFDLDQLGLFQWGCLHEAAANGHEELLRLLLQHGADPNCRDALQGCTPLHYAAEADDRGAAEALIEAGARLDLLSRTGQSALDAARGETRDLLLRKAPLLLRTEPERIKENHDLLDSISKVSSDPDLSIPSRSASTQSVSNLGSAELSFEFNARKDVLKVRIWRLFDLLLPPAPNSPIASLFLRGRIDLSPKGALKSDTEAVRAYADEEAEAEATFRFKEPLHFRHVTPEIVADRELHITLHVRTRRPPKSFPISRLELPLREAVLRVTKATYPLRPLPESQSRLPAKARVFGGSGGPLRPPLDCRSTYSSPSLRGQRAQPCARSASDSELREAALDLEAFDLPLNGVELLGGARQGLVTVTVHRADDDGDVALDVPLLEDEETSLTSVTEHCSPPRTAVDIPSMRDEEETSLASVTGHRAAPRTAVDVPSMRVDEEASLMSVTVHRTAGKKSRIFAKPRVTGRHSAVSMNIPPMEEEEKEEEETSLTSVTVHRAPEKARSTAVDVPLIEEEEEGLREVLSGGYDNPTFLGSVEYLSPPERTKRSSGLRVHRAARTHRKDLELCELP